MSIDELYNNISAGQYGSSVPYPSGKHYPEDHIFDEEKSVRWNRKRLSRKTISTSRTWLTIVHLSGRVKMPSATMLFPLLRPSTASIRPKPRRFFPGL